MQTAANQNFPPLDTETRSHVKTACAAFPMPQIMSSWVSFEQLSQAGKAATAVKQLQYFPPLDQETRSHVETACAAFHMNRKPQTMRSWASLENGAIRPVRINGRLAWSVAAIKNALNGGQ